jgi:hypothetical protein
LTLGNRPHNPQSQVGRGAGDARSPVVTRDNPRQLPARKRNQSAVEECGHDFAAAALPQPRHSDSVPRPLRRWRERDALSRRAARRRRRTRRRRSPLSRRARRASVEPERVRVRVGHADRPAADRGLEKLSVVFSSVPLPFPDVVDQVDAQPVQLSYSRERSRRSPYAPNELRGGKMWDESRSDVRRCLEKASALRGGRHLPRRPSWFPTRD